MGKEVVFYYDVVCPFAYMASRYVERLGQRTQAKVHWRPVLLGGLYEATKAAQGKAGSSTDVMSPGRLKMSVLDLNRQLQRLSVPHRDPVNHPQKTVDAMRMLAAITDDTLRVSVSHALYKAYWYESRDVSDHSVLERVADQFGLSSSQLLSSDTASKTLRANTAEAAERGAFGVPSFYTCGRLWWGVDRMFLVERALGYLDAEPDRLVLPPSQPSAAQLTFFFDYASPWSYLASERLERLVQSVYPVQVAVEYVPVLVGALFKKIGTPVVPMSVLSEAKRNYFMKDLQDWSEYSGVELNWPDTFPLHSVLSLRLTLAAQCDPVLIRRLHKAVWKDNLNIGNKEVLAQVVSEVDQQRCGTWLKEAESEKVKAQLFANTSRAVDAGLCGVPSFTVNGGSEVVWGQDRFNVLADYMCGLQQAKL